MITLDLDMKNKTLKKILFSLDDLMSYTHRTNSLQTCNNILESGFIFAESFHKTTDRILNDEVYLNYWNLQRKHYGNFVVVMAFSKDLIIKIQEEFLKNKEYVEVQQILSRKLDEKSEDDESRYLLPLFYVKGIYDLETEKFIPNEFFNPSFIPSNVGEWLELS